MPMYLYKKLSTFHKNLWRGCEILHLFPSYVEIYHFKFHILIAAYHHLAKYLNCSIVKGALVIIAKKKECFFF